MIHSLMIPELDVLPLDPHNSRQLSDKSPLLRRVCCRDSGKSICCRRHPVFKASLQNDPVTVVSPNCIPKLIRKPERLLPDPIRDAFL